MKEVSELADKEGILIINIVFALLNVFRELIVMARWLDVIAYL